MRLRNTLREIEALSGWRRRAVLLALGAIAGLALPPWFCWPLLLPSLLVFYRLLQRAPTCRTAFGAGAWWGFGYFFIGHYWIANALLVEPEKFAWLIPFTVTLIPLGLAITTGAASALWQWVGARKGISGVVAFAACFVLIEWVRSWLFTGFPWNLIGYTLNVSDTLMQLAALGGIWSMSLLVLLVTILPSVFFEHQGEANFRRVIPVAFSLALLVGAYGYGALRLANAEHTTTDTRIRIIQPNVAQHHKWDPERRRDEVLRHVTLSNSQPLDDIDAVIWSETAVPYVIDPNFLLLEEMDQARPKEGVLITGGLRQEQDTPQSHPRFYNSLFVLGQNGKTLTTYDKRHLVPFGEYIPFREWLPLTKLTAGTEDFSEGTGEAVVTMPNLPPVLPLICYEGIFPAEVDRAAQNGKQHAQWLLNITNDGWFRMSAGPYQHFEQERLRAVEQGLPLVRVANTGISAVVDGYGRVLASLPLGESGVMDIALPSVVQKTGYSAGVEWIIMGSLGLILLTFRIRQKFP